MSGQLYLCRSCNNPYQTAFGVQGCWFCTSLSKRLLFCPEAQLSHLANTQRLTEKLDSACAVKDDQEEEDEEEEEEEEEMCERRGDERKRKRG